MKKTILAFFLLLCLRSQASNVSSLSYAVTNVTTSAYVTILASTPVPTSKMIICDTSTHILKLATGSAGNEVDLFTVPVNSCIGYSLTTTVPAGTRFSLKAIDASATTGFNTVSLFQ